MPPLTPTDPRTSRPPASNPPSWSEDASRVADQVVRIQTRQGWGTAFFHSATDSGARFLVTAHHVIDRANREGHPFRIWHGKRFFQFGGRGAKDALLVRRDDYDVDTALIALINHDLPKPSVPVIAPSEASEVTSGTEVGWLGYPSLEGLTDRLCFFSGRISLADRERHRYLIDGTSVPGCSGGPVFCRTQGGLQIIGAMTEYLPHLLTPGATQVPTGALLPGLSVAVDVSHYDVIEQVIDKLPAPRQRSYTIKLDKCPKCDAPIVERTDVRDPTHALVCQASCGRLVDTLDRDIVDSFPGGTRKLAETLIDAFRQVNAPG